MSFTLDRLQRASYTSTRTKTDKSSAYAKLNYAGKGGVIVWIEKGNGRPVGSDFKNIKPGQETFIRNRAFENHGRTSVKLGVKSNYINAARVSARGVWSPDSI